MNAEVRLRFVHAVDQCDFDTLGVLTAVQFGCNWIGVSSAAHDELVMCIRFHFTMLYYSLTV